MKALKMVLIACSLSAAVAHAQTAVPTVGTQQVVQTSQQHANVAVQQGRASKHSRKADACVGPVSFCNVFFGS
jgi:hypothetical protein